MRYNLVLLSVKGILDFSFSFLFLFIAYFYLLWSSSLSWQFVWWYMFFLSRDYGGMSCLSYMRMAIWNNCIFFPFPSLFLGKKTVSLLWGCIWYRSFITAFFSSHV